jgi:lipoprotein-anchoring transpeptidase ErfK/SrfK
VHLPVIDLAARVKSWCFFIVLIGLSLGSPVIKPSARIESGQFGAVDSSAPESPHGMPRKPLDTAGEIQLLASPRIVIKKSERKLLLYSGDKLVRTYRVGLGLSPVGDKVREGDRRTPEGDFYIFTKNEKSSYYLSLGISYPNAAHAERGLRDGLINRSQYDTIITALNGRKAPPQNTELGGDIYIHGNGAGSDWTWGCVALENQDILELFNLVSVGTPVRIKP